MQPGLSRAIPMAILGFLLGALLVIVVRGLQSLDPLWDVGPGIAVASVITAVFFVWGMGAFDPSMSVHGEEAEHAPTLDENNAPPAKLLGGGIWQVITIFTLSLAVVFFAGASNLMTLQITADPLASTTAVGYFPVVWFGRELLISELVVFMAFIAFMFISLVAAAGLIGWLFYRASQGIAESQVAATGKVPNNVPLLAGNPALVPQPSRPLGFLPEGPRAFVMMIGAFVMTAAIFYVVLLPFCIPHAPEHFTGISIVMGLLAAVFVGRPAFLPAWAPTWALILFLFGVLYFIFYEVAIGLVLPARPTPGTENLIPLGILFVLLALIFLGRPAFLPRWVHNVALVLFLVLNGALIFNATFIDTQSFGYVNRVMLSLINAFVIAILLVRPSWVARFATGAAGVVARILRAVPRMLQK